MRFILLISVVCVVIVGASLALQQDGVKTREWEQIGTINGRPILGVKDVGAIDFANRYNRQPTPEDRQELAAITVRDVCKEMSDRLMLVVTRKLMQEFNVSVTPEEAALATEAVLPAHDPTLDLGVWREKWTAYNDAAHQVFDLHQDPEQVYQKLIAPLEQDQEQGHKSWVDSLVYWSTPEGRAQLAYVAKSTNIAQAIDKVVQWDLERQKLNDAIDSELAAGDPQFSSYLEEWRKTATDVSSIGEPGRFLVRQSSTMPKAELNFLNQKRHQFLMARYAEQQVTFSVPKVATQCNLGSSPGVRSAAR